MKRIFTLLFSGIFAGFAFAQDNPGWEQTFQRDPNSTEYLENSTGRTYGVIPEGRESVENGQAVNPEAASALGEEAPEESQAMALAAPVVAGNEADVITPEIQALAEALRNDPVKIYEHVRNHIQYECYYGSKKGAHLTLMEGSGNDFDHAALLVALLRAAGLSPTYEFGPYSFTYQELVDWWGLSATPYSYFTDSQFIAEYGLTNTSASAVAKARKDLAVYEYSKNAGYHYVEPWTAGGTNYYTIPLCAVKITVGGSSYLVSPAFKSYAKTTGIDLVAATGYNRANMLTSVGGTPGSPDYVTGLSEAGIGTRLTTYTSNLTAALRANHDAKRIDQIIGGRAIIQRSYASFAQIPIQFPDSWANDWCPPASWTAIPTAQMSKLAIKAGVYNYSTKVFSSTLYTQEVTMPSLAGKKISLAFSGNTTSVRLDETLIGSAFTVTAATVDVQLEAKHNHFIVSYQDANGVREPSDFVVSQTTRNNKIHVAPYIKGNTNAYTFAYSFGNPDKQLRKRQEQLEIYRRQGVASTDWRMRTEGLNVMALLYYQQFYDMGKALSSLYSIDPVIHHLFGRASQEGAFYIDVGLHLSNLASGDIDYDQSDRYGGLSTLFASAMEHGVLEQTQGTNQKAVSTVRMVQTANALGLRIYRATPSNWSTVKSQLLNYSTTSKNAIGAELTDAQDKALIPRSGAMTVQEWTGGGYAIEGPGKAMMRISDTLNGGYSALDIQLLDLLAYIYSATSTPGYEVTGSSPSEQVSYTPVTGQELSWDPIEMSSGAFVLDTTDLMLGSSAPRGLELSRHYHSNRRHDDSSGLGYGWVRNSNVFITERSAPDAALGGANAYQMAPFLAAAIAAKDLHSNHTNATQWAGSALIVHWALEQMRYKAVSVTLGNRSYQFVIMPDGSYEPPPGTNLTLAKSNGVYVLTERNGNAMTFDASLRLSTIKNPNGGTQTFTYNGATREVATVTDAYGRVLTLTWSGGKLASVNDGTGRSVSYTYTTGDLTSYTDPEGKVWTYQYDSDHRMISYKDPDGRKLIENDFDGANRVVRQRSMGDSQRQWTYLYSGYVSTEIDPLGGETRYFYDERGRSLGVTDSLGNRSQYAYDGQDRKTFQITPKGETTAWTYDSSNNVLTETDAKNFLSQFFYDSQKRLQRIRDKRAKDTIYTYTSAHQVATVTDPLGHTMSTVYNSDGTAQTITDAEGKITSYQYDSYGQLKKTTYHDGKFRSATSNARGDVLTITDGAGRTVTNTYNKRRQLLTTTLPAVPGEPAAVINNVYDNCGNLQSVTDAKGNTTSKTYNALGKTLTTAQPVLPTGSNVVTETYDRRDWPDTTFNSLNQTVSYTLDAAQRVVAVTDPLGRRTDRQYDANSRLQQSTDPASRTTKQVWNARGEVERTTDGLTRHTDSTFDGNGNRTQLTNRRGKIYTFAFDDANRLTGLTTPSGRTSSTTYFNNNLAKTLVEPSGQTTTLAYNGRNLVQTKTDPVGAVSYTYDDSDLPLTTTEGASTITRTYDERSRLKTFTNADGDVLQYRYDANNNLTRLTYPDGKQVQYGYNARNQLETVTDWVNRVTTYHYDRLGRLTGVTRPNGTTSEIARDASSQVLSVKETAGGKLFLYLKFGYDDAGQVKKRFRAPAVHSAWQQPAFSAAVDVDDRLVSVNGSAVSYDTDGNMTAGPITAASGSSSLAYNSRNQLTSAGGISFTYDPEGRRRTTSDGSGTTRYVVEPGSSSLLVRHTPDGQRTWYVYGLGLLYEVSEAGSTKTYHFDQVGSAVARTDDIGAVIGTAEYSAYGLTTVKTGDMNTPFLFNGELGVQTDANGLLYMRARYYSPYLMRFVNADPSGFGGGNNWFAFANGNPVSLSDPFGLRAEQARRDAAYMAAFNARTCMDCHGNWDVLTYGASAYQMAWFNGENYEPASKFVVGTVGAGGLVLTGAVAGPYVVSAFLANPVTATTVTETVIVTGAGLAGYDGVPNMGSVADDIARAAKVAPAHVFERLEASSLQNADKIADLAADMRVNGWVGEGVSVFEHNGSKYILDGHHRVSAAKAAGIEVPYNSIPENRLPEFHYKSVDEVIWSASEAGGF